jgi:hypothetical protein
MSNSMGFCRKAFARQVAGAALAIATVMASATASAAVIFSNSHAYGGLITIDVTVEDNYLGDFGKYWWKYNVHNLTFDPNPGTSNGFSGFETALPAGVPDLLDRAAPTAAWIFDCCSGDPVEYDITNTGGLGVMPGGSGLFSFTSLPRFITTSTGWFHTWQHDSQTDVTFYTSFPDQTGPEVPDVLRPPIPEPGTLALLGIGFAGLAWRRRKQ